MNRSDRRDKKRWLAKQLKTHNQKMPSYKPDSDITEREQERRVNKMVAWVTRKQTLLKKIQECS